MSCVPCPRCASPVPEQSLGCPYCGAADADTSSRAAGMVLLGLTMTGPACITQDLYGVAISDTGYIDDDGDGYAETDGDCDDSDPDIHPDADETPGDGVDSNCDGADDT